MALWFNFFFFGSLYTHNTTRLPKPTFPNISGWNGFVCSNLMLHQGKNIAKNKSENRNFITSPLLRSVGEPGTSLFALSEKEKHTEKLLWMDVNKNSVERHHYAYQFQHTHSSITRPSPTTRGPASTGGFFWTSSAASASASCRFSFSRAWKNQSVIEHNTPITLLMVQNISFWTHRTRTLGV